jgi:glycosyltransferase involved in cell wall biosynthesis
VRDFWLLDDAPIFGGAERNMLRLARFIQESLPDRSARIVCPSESELASRCRVAGIPVVHATFPDLGPLAAPRIARAVRHLRRVLRDAGRDAIVVGPTLRSQVYAHAAVLGMRRAPRIVHFLPEQDSARRLTARLILRRGVVVVGENAARTYRQRLPAVHVRAVNTFLLEEDFANAARESRPRVQSGPPAVGVLARLIPEKGVLELAGELASARDKWSSVVVGGERESESYARAVEAQIEALGLDKRVRLLGHVEDIGSFFDEIDVLVVPSVGNEGQPTVIVEALAHGRPAIVRERIWSSDFVGLPVFPYRDAHDLERLLESHATPILDPEELAKRFGPRQLLDAFEAVSR